MREPEHRTVTVDHNVYFVGGRCALRCDGVEELSWSGYWCSVFGCRLEKSPPTEEAAGCWHLRRCDKCVERCGREG